MSARLAAIAAAALLAAGCASRSVQTPPAPLPQFEPAFDVRASWSADVGEGAEDYLGLVPRAAGGVVYVAGADGRVGAYDVETGRRVWETELDTALGGCVGLGEDRVTVGTRDGHVIALARDSGREVWRARVSSEVLAPPVAGGGYVIAQTVDGRVHALAAEDGKRLWVYERSEPALSLRGLATPVLLADAVLAGFASGRLVALALADGALLWEAPVSQARGRNEIERLVDVDASALVFPDAIYAATYQGRLTAFNPRSGNVIWSRELSTYTGLAADAERLYATDERGHVIAFDRRNGTVVWRQEGLRGRRLNAPAVYGEYVVVADFEGYVHWLARADGRFLARHRAASAPVRAPAVPAEERLLVLATSGELAALRVAP
jgi:outer membrane protein assembly factor BamB